MRLILASVVLALPAVAFAQPSAQERLWDASIAGDTTAIIQALSDGADVDSLDTRRSRNGRRALNWAALGDHVPAIRVLLRHGATLEARNLTGFTPLHHAAEVGSARAARALLDAGADPAAANAAGNRPADTARQNGHIGVALLITNAASNER
jgi:ankyrin repeat protein